MRLPEQSHVPCTSGQRSEVSFELLLSPPTLLRAESLTGPETCHFSQAGWPESPREPPISALPWPALGSEASTTELDSFVDAKGPNSGAGAFSTDTLPTEPPP